jgi:acetyl-CoA acetyltransferase
MAAQAYLHRYGGTREKLAEIAVAAREWALLNPKAYRYGAGPLSVADVVGAPMVSSPLTVDTGAKEAGADAFARAGVTPVRCRSVHWLDLPDGRALPLFHRAD